jgi:hypothetical protein
VLREGYIEPLKPKNVVYVFGSFWADVILGPVQAYNVARTDAIFVEQRACSPVKERYHGFRGTGSREDRALRAVPLLWAGARRFTLVRRWRQFETWLMLNFNPPFQIRLRPYHFGSLVVAVSSKFFL